MTKQVEFILDNIENITFYKRYYANIRWFDGLPAKKNIFGFTKTEGLEAGWVSDDFTIFPPKSTQQLKRWGYNFDSKDGEKNKNLTWYRKAEVIVTKTTGTTYEKSFNTNEEALEFIEEIKQINAT